MVADSTRDRGPGSGLPAGGQGESGPALPGHPGPVRGRRWIGLGGSAPRLRHHVEQRARAHRTARVLGYRRPGLPGIPEQTLWCDLHGVVCQHCRAFPSASPDPPASHLGLDAAAINRPRAIAFDFSSSSFPRRRESRSFGVHSPSSRKGLSGV